MSKAKGGSLSNEEVERQLNNMRNFIIKEAEEKRDEIIHKAKEEFTLSKTEIFQEERLKIIKEFERRAKQMESEQKIKYSNMHNQARLKVLSAREEIISSLRDETKHRLTDISKQGPEYQKLLKELIVQALLKLSEKDVLVKCRESDVEMVNAVLHEASAEYKVLSKQDVNLKIDKSHNLPPAPTKSQKLIEGRYCFGGIVLAAQEERILCDNTLDQRLSLAFEASIPGIRKMLFPEKKEEKKD